jgi:hypothetical protein
VRLLNIAFNCCKDPAIQAKFYNCYAFEVCVDLMAASFAQPVTDENLEVRVVRLLGLFLSSHRTILKSDEVDILLKSWMSALYPEIRPHIYGFITKYIRKYFNRFPEIAIGRFARLTNCDGNLWRIVGLSIGIANGLDRSHAIFLLADGLASIDRDSGLATLLVESVNVPGLVEYLVESARALDEASLASMALIGAWSVVAAAIPPGIDPNHIQAITEAVCNDGLLSQKIELFECMKAIFECAEIEFIVELATPDLATILAVEAGACVIEVVRPFLGITASYFTRLGEARQTDFTVVATFREVLETFQKEIPYEDDLLDWVDSLLQTKANE